MTGVNKTTAGPRSVSLVQRRLEIENLSFPARFHVEVVACGPWIQTGPSIPDWWNIGSPCILPLGFPIK